MRSNETVRARIARRSGIALLIAVAWSIPCAVIGEQQSNAAAGVLALADLEKLVGQGVDIASSAYEYRADRPREENPPESWLALMRFANLPLNQPLDVSTPALAQVLCGLLWEEIRPIQKLELTWAANAASRPAPEELVITTLDALSTASSWWNNLGAAQKAVRPAVSADGNTLVYELQVNTCGIVISLSDSKRAADFAVPEVRVLVADTWKQMDLEIEWGFDQSSVEKDYSGRVEVYDGRVAGLSPLDCDTGTTVTTPSTWQSPRTAGARRGVKASLVYMGRSKWRRRQPFTTQSDDVARTIVTIWTESGNFSFLAADLENGPILAPEYGFFVRRTSEPPPPQAAVAADFRVPRIMLTEKMVTIAGDNRLLGWGSDATPWLGGNPTAAVISVQGITFPARCVAMHPGAEVDVAVGWCSPIAGQVKVVAQVAHAQGGSNGIQWQIAHESKSERQSLANGATEGQGSAVIAGSAAGGVLGALDVEPGDLISLVVGRNGAHQCDTVVTELWIREVGGQGRTWSLTEDVVNTLHASNPHADGQDHTAVWHFYSERAVFPAFVPAAAPPLELASQAGSAQQFIKELRMRQLTTIRQQLQLSPEQTWEGAVTAMRGPDLPPHPAPPPGSEPAMQVQVPCARLTAQWNLGAWHLTRHAQTHPQSGRMWFNDHPYGILGAETYLILAALDLMGSHKAAADGFEQWLSLPMDPDSTGHHEWALPDRPNGLFSEGHGCLTHAVGPPGVGGHMDGVHAFGPGSIGWALTQHYSLTGDSQWLTASAPRIVANAQWMARQRRTVRDMVPGGERLWCQGLQPALQVTPDSGGLWMQFYECEAYYWVSLLRLAKTLIAVNPAEGAGLLAEAEAYRQDLRAAVERSIALSPVVPVRDGTYHSVIPFACYVRGLATGAWGWQRDGSGSHVGPLYWETVQSAAALISPAGLLPPDDVRVQGYLDVLEDRLLLENTNVGDRDWFLAGWQYQGGLERTANMHLAADDIPSFIRSFLNCYAVDILPGSGYVFNEHAVHGPPDKIFEEAAFLERMRNMLVMEQDDMLWIARGTPRTWLTQGQQIVVKNAPTHFGPVTYEIVSDVDHGSIAAKVELPARDPPKSVRLRLRHPVAAPIQRVTVNGKTWSEFNVDKQTIELTGLTGTVHVLVSYR